MICQSSILVSQSTLIHSLGRDVPFDSVDVTIVEVSGREERVEADKSTVIDALVHGWRQSRNGPDLEDIVELMVSGKGGSARSA